MESNENNNTADIDAICYAVLERPQALEECSGRRQHADSRATSSLHPRLGATKIGSTPNWQCPVVSW